MRDTRHAARTRAHASRPSRIASKLFELPSLNATGYFRGRNWNAELLALFQEGGIFFIDEIAQVSCHILKWFKLSHNR